MPTDFDERIAALATRLEEKRAGAETTLNKFFDVVAVELTSHLRQWVQEESRRQHSVLTTLAVERVTALKVEMEQILAALPQHVRKWCNQDQFWAHRQKWRPQNQSTLSQRYTVDPGDRRGPYLEGGYQLDEVLSHGVRDLMSSFLERYGFKFTSHGGHKFVMNSIHWNEAMNTAVNQYATAYDDFTKTQNELAKAKEEKGRHEAEELWNKA